MRAATTSTSHTFISINNGRLRHHLTNIRLRLIIRRRHRTMSLFSHQTANQPSTSFFYLQIHQGNDTSRLQSRITFRHFGNFTITRRVNRASRRINRRHFNFFKTNRRRAMVDHRIKLHNSLRTSLSTTRRHNTFMIFRIVTNTNTRLRRGIARRLFNNRHIAFNS